MKIAYLWTAFQLVAERLESIGLSPGDAAELELRCNLKRRGFEAHNQPLQGCEFHPVAGLTFHADLSGDSSGVTLGPFVALLSALASRPESAELEATLIAEGAFYELEALRCDGPIVEELHTPGEAPRTLRRHRPRVYIVASLLTA